MFTRSVSTLSYISQDFKAAASTLARYKTDTRTPVEREPAGPTDHNAESFGSRPGINLRMWTPTDPR